MRDREQKLQEELTGYRQVIELDQAMLAAVLNKTGEVTVRREDIRRCLQEKRQVRAAQTEEGFRLWLEDGNEAFGIQNEE